MNAVLRALFVASLVGAILPTNARADRRELYTVLSAEPGWFSYNNPLSDTGTAGTLAGSAALGAYYGIADTLHLGGVLRFGYSRDVAYDSVTVTLPGGTPSQGQLFQNHSQLGVSALALYRFDIGFRLAPVLSVEAGIARHSFSSLEHIPAGTSFAYFYDDRSEVAFFWRPMLAAEYRLTDRFVFSVGGAVTMSPKSHARLQVTVPVTVGVIW